MVTKASPNVVPLCDILLVLLIIFMVITPMVQAGVDVMLPAGNGPRGGPIVLTIQKDGFITVNNEKFTDLELLEKWLTDLYRTRNDSTIFVQSHKHVLYKNVVKVIDLVKGVGVENVCLMPQEMQ
jgi:biopolymer transport protein TolR